MTKSYYVKLYWKSFRLILVLYITLLLIGLVSVAAWGIWAGGNIIELPPIIHDIMLYPLLFLVGMIVVGGFKWFFNDVVIGGYKNIIKFVNKG
tara:strand:+ start:225245 stop:225523 length:279 start_codon:yes stop_codon:yes gene_type:complete